MFVLKCKAYQNLGIATTFTRKFGAIVHILLQVYVNMDFIYYGTISQMDSILEKSCIIILYIILET